MKFKALLIFSAVLLNSGVNCDEQTMREGRILNTNNRKNFDTTIEEQFIQEYSNQASNGTEASADDVIEEIINSNRQGRNIEGLEDVYSDANIKEALSIGNEIEARNLIRDKLCDLGLMQCDELIPKRYPTRVIYTQPPPGAIFTGNRPQQGPPQFNNIQSQPPPQYSNNPHSKPPQFNNFQSQPPPQYSNPQSSQFNNNIRPPQQLPPSLIKGGQIYGPAKPMPFPPSQPPRKIGYAHSDLNTFESNSNKFSDFYESEPHLSGGVKFGYTEKPTIVINQAQQGKREANGASQNHHVHHHYVHVDGSSDASNVGGLIDGTKTVLVNTPISEYSAVGLSPSYQTTGSGYASQASSSNLNGFTPMNPGFEYKGVNSGASQPIYQSVKPVFENSQSQYASGSNFNKYTQVTGPAVYTEGTNGIYSNGNNAQQSFHSTAPDFYKKELNLNGNRGNGLSSAGGYASQQQTYLNTQKYQPQLPQQSNNLYNKNQYTVDGQYQAFESNRQDQFDCVCVPFDQCPAHDIVGRRDDLILPLDPRNLPTEIEAAESDNNATISSSTNSTTTEVKKISKRSVPSAGDDVQRVEGEGRLLGFGGGGGGHYPQQYSGGKKVLPTLGVSFGLPFPTAHYPLTPFAPHAPNAHFGAISPNGLNLGLVNVNPLFSLQVTKNELGEKLVKPFVNLHVTPNEGIVGKIGNLLLAKKGPLHKHYHHHLHRYPQQPPHSFYGEHDNHHYPPPHHIEEPQFLSHPPPYHGSNNIPHFSEGPIFSPHGPPPFPPHHQQQHFSELPPPPHHFYKDSGFSKDTFIDDISTNPGILGFRSSNISLDNDFNYQSVYPNNNDFRAPNLYQDDTRYARGYSNYNKNYNLPTQAPGTAEGSEKVSFPTSRRRRDTDQPVPAFLEKKKSEDDDDSSIEAEDTEDSEGRAINANKRQAFYQPQQQLQQQQQQKQCGPRAVCCRKPFNNKPAPIQYSRCGVRSSQGINGRIKNPVYVDGNSEFGEWPWQAAILKKDPKESVYVCGGTLISDSYLITAAHCVKTYSGFDLRVRLGEWDVNHDVEFYPYVEKDIISVHIHPEYYAGTLDNDIAILKLSSPVELSSNPHITPACLPDKFSDYSGHRCWTTGWGKDNWEYGKYQNILKEVDVPIIDQHTCQAQLRNTRLGRSYNLNPGFLCAGGEEGKDACKGDGGGPLVCERNGVWNVVGAVSWGIGCGNQNVPGVYVKIAHYLDWIQQITRY